MQVRVEWGVVKKRRVLKVLPCWVLFHTLETGYGTVGAAKQAPACADASTACVRANEASTRCSKPLSPASRTRKSNERLEVNDPFVRPPVSDMGATGQRGHHRPTQDSMRAIPE